MKTAASGGSGSMWRPAMKGLGWTARNVGLPVATTAGTVYGIGHLANRELNKRLPNEFTVTPAERKAQLSSAAKPRLPSTTAGAAANPGIWDQLKQTWGDLPTPAKWGIGLAGGGLAAYLLYQLLRSNRRDD